MSGSARARASAAAFALVVLLAGWLQYRQVSRLNVSPRPEGIAAGKSAPELIAPDPTGVRRRLTDFKGKVVIVSFWASWCTPCRLEMPEIAELAAEHNRDSRRTHDVVYLAVNIQEDPATIRRTLKDERFKNVTFLFDRDGEIAERWNVQDLPTTIIVSPQGNVLQSMVGYEPGLQYSIRGILSPFRERSTPITPKVPGEKTAPPGPGAPTAPGRKAAPIPPAAPAATRTRP